MKRILIMLVASPFMAFSQENAINENVDCLMSNRKQNNLYAGVNNYVDVIVNKHSCSSINFKISNGIIEQQNQTCTYTVVPKEKGNCVISIFENNTNDYIGNYEFSVIDLPLPVVIVNGKEGGNISAITFKAQLGIQAELLGFDFQSKYTITKFSIIIIRNNKVLFNGTNLSHLFSEDVKNVLKSIQAGDKVIFSDVWIHSKSTDKINIRPAEFLII